MSDSNGSPKRSLFDADPNARPLTASQAGFDDQEDRPNRNINEEQDLNNVTSDSDGEPMDVRTAAQRSTVNDAEDSDDEEYWSPSAGPVGDDTATSTRAKNAEIHHHMLEDLPDNLIAQLAEGNLTNSSEKNDNTKQAEEFEQSESSNRQRTRKRRRQDNHADGEENKNVEDTGTSRVRSPQRDDAHTPSVDNDGEEVEDTETNNARSKQRDDDHVSSDGRGSADEGNEERRRRRRRGRTSRDPGPEFDGDVRLWTVQNGKLKRVHTRSPAVPWQPDEVAALEEGLEHFRSNQWSLILERFEDRFHLCRTPVSLKDKARNEYDRRTRNNIPLGAFRYYRQ